MAHDFAADAVLVGCVLVALGMVVNISVHSWHVMHHLHLQRKIFVTGTDVANEAVWWLVNPGMLFIATGIFVIVKRYFLR